MYSAATGTVLGWAQLGTPVGSTPDAAYATVDLVGVQLQYYPGPAISSGLTAWISGTGVNRLKLQLSVGNVDLRNGAYSRSSLFGTRDVTAITCPGWLMPV